MPEGTQGSSSKSDTMTKIKKICGNGKSILAYQLGRTRCSLGCSSKLSGNLNFDLNEKVWTFGDSDMFHPWCAAIASLKQAGAKFIFDGQPGPCDTIATSYTSPKSAWISFESPDARSKTRRSRFSNSEPFFNTEFTINDPNATPQARKLDIPIVLRREMRKGLCLSHKETDKGSPSWERIFHEEDIILKSDTGGKLTTEIVYRVPLKHSPKLGQYTGDNYPCKNLFFRPKDAAHALAFLIEHQDLIEKPDALRDAKWSKEDDFTRESDFSEEGLTHTFKTKHGIRFTEWNLTPQSRINYPSTKSVNDLVQDIKESGFKSAVDEQFYATKTYGKQGVDIDWSKGLGHGYHFLTRRDKSGKETKHHAICAILPPKK